jgi:hypothetical protein
LEPCADEVIQLGERFRQTAPVLVAKLGRREASVKHPQQGLAMLFLKDELHLGLKARAIETSLRGRHQQPPRPIDDLEDMAVAVDPVLRGTELDRPDAADP